MRNPQREEFLRDIAIIAVEGGIGYWSSCTKYRWSVDGSLEAKLPFPEISIVPSEDPEDFDPCEITQETIVKGLKLISEGSPELNLHIDYRKQIIAADAVNDACDIDAELADYVVQAGLFGKMVFG